MKKITSTDVAKLAGVSQSTVSMVLNNKVGPSFSMETRNRVLEAAAQLGYSLPAQEYGPSGEKLIAVMVPTITNTFYTHLYFFIEQTAVTAGYKVILCNTSRNLDFERYYMDFFSKVKAAGIIFTFVPSYPQLVEQIALSTPVVLIGEKKDTLSIPSIELNNVQAGRMIGEYLVSLGHEHFAFFTTPQDRISLARTQRLAGLKEALREADMEKNLEVFMDETAREWDSSMVPFEYETGQRLTERFLRSGSRATALIAINDMTALGILHVLQVQKKRIPQDYSICGFDNIFQGQVSSPAITTIDHHLNLRAEAAVNLILSKRGEEKEKGTASGITREVSKIEYAPLLVIRESTGRCG